MIKLLVWNCCGIASKGVAYVVKDMKDRYKLDVLVILEPRISGVHASKVIKCWGYRKSIKMEADGFANSGQCAKSPLRLALPYRIHSIRYSL